MTKRALDVDAEAGLGLSRRHPPRHHANLARRRFGGDRRALPLGPLLAQPLGKPRPLASALAQPLLVVRPQG